MTGSDKQTQARAARGAFGERMARLTLEAAGYRVLAQNWRCRGGELDLVTEVGEEIVFVEVRTRRGSVPEASIGPIKQRRLRTAAQSWLAAHGRAANAWRIDAMLIELDAGGRLIRCEQIVAAVEDQSHGWL